MLRIFVLFYLLCILAACPLFDLVADDTVRLVKRMVNPFKRRIQTTIYYCIKKLIVCVRQVQRFL